MKKMFKLLLIVSSLNVFGQITYSGFIDKSPIEFYTADYFPEHESSYSYSNNIDIIKLKGEAIIVDEMLTGKIVFYENDKNGKNTARLTFEHFNTKKNQLEGTWTDLISTKQLKIKLLKNKLEKLSKNDSIIIEKHLRKLEVEERVKYTINSDDPKFNTVVQKILSGDKKTSELYPEQEPSVGNMNWHSGTVHYAPDKAFKIFVFEGESCGAHCNTSYGSFIQFKSGKIIQQNEEASFNHIDSLFKTGPNTYGVIEISSSSGITGRVYCYWAQFSISKGHLNYLKKTSFGLDSHWSLAAYMKYNSTDKKIMFRYERMKYELFETESLGDLEKELVKKIPKQLLPFQDDEILVVKGEFKIANGKITNFKEWYEKGKEPHQDD